MPFVVFDEVEKEFVTPKYSTAYGELVTGDSSWRWAGSPSRRARARSSTPIRTSR